ncbi:MAG: DUF6399 domain-containing protein [Lamprobacter sp.]|uniref:DUF6399 domain-containing protein n=1 Tax=Lamprobacter sp. TaxID=3100796 RepID=UPI002B259DFE|nr:DUF6399 domain-containing protein [Lamprobacter sp.]MEA3643289.1 DUF6399 domain-containing protein [Lamprobacter sp.]
MREHHHLHNFATRRRDGTTAAEHFFAQPHPALFEQAKPLRIAHDINTGSQRPMFAVTARAMRNAPD